MNHHKRPIARLCTCCALMFGFAATMAGQAITPAQQPSQNQSSAQPMNQPAAPVDRELIYWTSSVGVDYTTGKYGDVTSTSIWSIPFTARLDYDRWSFQGSVPYVRISGPASVLPGLGSAFVGRVRPSSRTEHGIGDFTLGAGYSFFASPNEPASDFHLETNGKVKFPTADRAKGLGTGEADVSVQADVYQAFGDITPFATLGYRAMGDPPGIDYRNFLFTSLGASYRVNRTVNVGASFDWRQKLLSFGDDESSLTAFASWRYNRTWKFSGYLLTGFTHAAPDFGLGLVSRYTF